ncbi:MAG TPA: response regulator [Polyangia bacterium]|nr:response regulator [Polyangia bacterium]
MTDEPLRILLVEDSPSDAKLVVQSLRKLTRPIVFERIDTAADMNDRLDRQAVDVVLSDWSMPHFSALAALKVVRDRALDVPFIIVSGTLGEEAAVEAMRAGAHDYVLKDKLGRLPVVVERELRERSARRTAEEARRRAEAALRSSEEQLRHAQKMEAVGRLAGGVAHDFNNLLSVILTYVGMAAETLPPDDPRREELVEAHTAATRAAALTRQLLLFSRQQPTEELVLDLNEMLRSLHNMIRRIVGEDVEVTLLPPAERGHVKIDPTHIEQVVMNLVVNARDAMPTGGKLTLGIRNETITQERPDPALALQPGPYVVLSVTDTGSGMTPEVQARIFEPFYTTKEIGKGTGLGLSTVFGIAQKSGGAVAVRSQPGAGTAFAIYLPLVDGADQQPRPSVNKVNLRGNESILLVEDDEQVRAAAFRILSRYGYRVLSARGPLEALALCESHPGKLDLLLTDVVMPGMSGSTLAERVKGMRPDIKVLWMSGYTDDSVIRHGVASSGLAYLQKPITPVSLGTKVRSLLGGEAT